METPGAGSSSPGTGDELSRSHLTVQQWRDNAASQACEHACKTTVHTSHTRCDACSVCSTFGTATEVADAPVDVGSNGDRTYYCLSCRAKGACGGIVTIQGAVQSPLREGFSSQMGGTDVDEDQALELLDKVYARDGSDPRLQCERIEHAAQMSRWAYALIQTLGIEVRIDAARDHEEAHHDSVPVVRAALDVIIAITSAITSASKGQITRWVRSQPEGFANGNSQCHWPLQLLFCKFPSLFGTIKTLSPLGFASDADKVMLIEVYVSWAARVAADAVASKAANVPTDPPALFERMIAALPAPFRYVVLMASHEPRMRVLVDSAGTTLVCLSMHEFVMTLAQANCVWPCTDKQCDAWTVHCLSRGFGMHPDSANVNGMDLRGSGFDIGQLVDANTSAATWATATPSSLSSRQLVRAAPACARAVGAAAGARSTTEEAARSTAISVVAAEAVDLARRSRQARTPPAATSNTFAVLGTDSSDGGSSGSGVVDAGSIDDGDLSADASVADQINQVELGPENGGGLRALVDAAINSAPFSISNGIPRLLRTPDDHNRVGDGGGTGRVPTSTDYGYNPRHGVDHANGGLNAIHEFLNSTTPACTNAQRGGTAPSATPGGYAGSCDGVNLEDGDGGDRQCRFSSCINTAPLRQFACGHDHSGIDTDGSKQDNIVIAIEAGPRAHRAAGMELMMAAFPSNGGAGQAHALSVMDILFADHLFGDTDDEADNAACYDWGDPTMWPMAVLSNGPQPAFNNYPEVMNYLATDAERDRISRLLTAIEVGGRSTATVANTFEVVRTISAIADRTPDRAFPKSAWHFAKTISADAQRGHHGRSGPTAPVPTRIATPAKKKRGIAVEAARARTAKSRAATASKQAKIAARAEKAAAKAGRKAKRAAAREQQQQRRLEERRRQREERAARERAEEAREAAAADTDSSSSSISSDSCNDYYYDNDADNNEGKRGAKAQPAGQPQPQRRRAADDIEDCDQHVQQEEEESKFGAMDRDSKTGEPDDHMYAIAQTAHLDGHAGYAATRALAERLVKDQPMQRGGRDWNGQTRLPELEVIISKLVERGARVGDKDDDPSPAMRAQLDNGEWYDMTFNNPQLLVEFTGGAAKMTSKDRDGKRWPHIGCSKQFKVIMILAKKCCLRKQIEAQKRVNQATCAYDIQVARSHVVFYQAAVAAFEVFTVTMTRMWTRHKQQSYTAALRLKWNRQLSNYVNWILRAYVVDGVFIITWNDGWFEDCKNVATPIPTRRCLTDMKMAVENNSLAAHQVRTTAASSATTPVRKPRAQPPQPTRPRQQRAQAAPRAAAAPRAPAARQARVQDMSGAPPSSHETLTNVCYRCGADGHSTGTCTTPKDSTTWTAAQKAANAAIKARIRVIDTKRQTWMAEQRRREAK